MRSIVGVITYRLLQVILLPFAAAGYAVFVAQSVAYGRRSGTSATVLASLYTRYMQHRLGTRNDEPAARLMMVMPGVSHPGLFFVTLPTLLTHRLTGYVPGIYRYPYEGEPPLMHHPAARTTYYDNAIERHIRDVEQFVVLGAGFDTRVYRLPDVGRQANVRCFEVDAPRTQAFKREMLAKAGVDAMRATYVPADFQKEDWFEQLVNAGFDPEKPSLFTWEGVTMYLYPDAVESSLRKIASTAAGSIVAFDYFSAELIESNSFFMRYARAVMRRTGEPWHFGIDNTPPARQRAVEFLERCGLVMEEQRNFGPETKWMRAMAGFAIANVPSHAAFTPLR